MDMLEPTLQDHKTAGAGQRKANATEETYALSNMMKPSKVLLPDPAQEGRETGHGGGKRNNVRKVEEEEEAPEILEDAGTQVVDVQAEKCIQVPELGVDLHQAIERPSARTTHVSGTCSTVTMRVFS